MTYIPKNPIEESREIFITDITPADLPAVVRMLEDLAEYEEVTEPVRSTVHSLQTVMFGPQPTLSGFIARKGDEAAGIILFYETYSTFAATKKLFVEDLFVAPECRGGGVGRQLIAAVARRCLARGCRGVHWRVLEANGPGIRFYRAIGAVVSCEHRNCSLTGPELQALTDNPLPVPRQTLRFADTGGAC